MGAYMYCHHCSCPLPSPEESGLDMSDLLMVLAGRYSEPLECPECRAEYDWYPDSVAITIELKIDELVKKTVKKALNKRRKKHGK